MQAEALTQKSYFETTFAQQIGEVEYWRLQPTVFFVVDVLLWFRILCDKLEHSKLKMH